MKSSRQNDKLEQWVMHTAVKDVLESFLGCNKQKVFFHFQLSVLYSLSNPICFPIDHFSIRSKNRLNKAKTVETVANSKLRRTDIINKCIYTELAVK